MIWLRHKTDVTTVSMRFRELSLDDRMSVRRKTGESLRGSTHDHLLSKARRFVVVISADETYGTTSTPRDFLRAFWEAEERWINLDTGASEPVSGWIAVATEGGETPFVNVEDCDLLPEFTFTLIAKEAS